MQRWNRQFARSEEKDFFLFSLLRVSSSIKKAERVTGKTMRRAIKWRLMMDDASGRIRNEGRRRRRTPQIGTAGFIKNAPRVPLSYISIKNVYTLTRRLYNPIWASCCGIHGPHESTPPHINTRALYICVFLSFSLSLFLLTFTVACATPPLPEKEFNKRSNNLARAPAETVDFSLFFAFVFPRRSKMKRVKWSNAAPYSSFLFSSL